MTSNSNKLAALREIDVSHLSKAEAKEFTILLEELEKREFHEKATGTFLDFVKSICNITILVNLDKPKTKYLVTIYTI